MLTFTFYHLLKNPEAYRKAQQEVDQVIGKDSVRLEHLNKLPYINAVLRESSRLHSTAPGFALTPNNLEGEILGSKYHVKHGEPVFALLPNIHRDPAVYGEDAEAFRPERMLDENFNKLPPNSWKVRDAISGATTLSSKFMLLICYNSRSAMDLEAVSVCVLGNVRPDSSQC